MFQHCAEIKEKTFCMSISIIIRLTDISKKIRLPDKDLDDHCDFA